MIVEEKKIPKDESLKNSTYNGTDKWMKSTEVIKLTTRNGGASITDEIPGGGMVRQRIAAQENQIQSNKLQLINSTSNSSTITSSSSEISISSQSSEESNHVPQEEKKKTSLIPSRSSSVLSNNNSLKSINSGSGSSLSSITSSKIPILKSSTLFKSESLKDNTGNWYKINKAESWILISPELLNLVKDQKLLEDTDSRKADALTYRKTDKVRLMNLNKNEILILEEKLPKLCENLKSNKRINIFRN